MRTGTEKLARVFETVDSPGRIVPMEGLRGFAVLLIFLVHYHTLFSGYLAPDSWMFRVSEAANIAGHSGVDLFFIVSGYLIYGRLLRKGVSYRSYFRRRVRRIYPAFACVLAVYVLLHFTFFPIPQVPAESTRAAIFILQSAALLPGLFDIPPVFAVAWSLSYEIFFYSTIPLLVRVARLQHRRAGARVLFFLGLAAAYSLFHLAAAGWQIAPLRLFPAAHPRLLMFVAGILMYELHMSPMASRLTGKGEAAVAGLLAAGYAANWLLVKNNWMVDHLPTSISRVAVLSAGLSGTVLYCFAYRGVLQEVFSWTPLRWLGNMSYSYYLAHGLALHGLRLAAGRILPPDGGSTVAFAALLPAALLLTLAASAVLFVAVEKPLSLAPSTRFRG